MKIYFDFYLNYFYAKKNTSLKIKNRANPPSVSVLKEDPSNMLEVKTDRLPIQH